MTWYVAVFAVIGAGVTNIAVSYGLVRVVEWASRRLRARRATQLQTQIDREIAESQQRTAKLRKQWS